MKALTLTQPWASLVAAGAKTIETRSWRTSYRGWLAIHAAQGFPWDCQELCSQEPFTGALAAAGYTEWRQLPRGSVAAVVRLRDCCPTRAAHGDWLPPWLPEEGTREHAFGDFSPRRYGWFLEDVRRFPEPIPTKGALSLWEWECSLAQLESVGLTLTSARRVIDPLRAAEAALRAPREQVALDLFQTALKELV